MNHILFWNAAALAANRNDFSNMPGTNLPRREQGGPTLSARALAMVHLAMYDAHAGAVNKPGVLPPYRPGLPGANGADPAEATAYAAHATLSALYPSQRAFFDERLVAAGFRVNGSSTGRDFGLAVASAMFSDRGGDPKADDVGYVASTDPGRHRPDPVNPDQGFHAPYYGAAARGFAITARHTLDKPPLGADPTYIAALRQVRGLGVAPELMGALPPTLRRRSVDQTLVGLFWAYDGSRGLGTPPRLYNLIVREIAISRNNDDDTNARLFALVNAAMADAAILAWAEKYRHDVWRPIVGIREHDLSMGPGGGAPTDNISDDCDPAWLPLGAPASNSREPDFSPNFPAYPSGHATFGAAALHMVRLFYGVPQGNRQPDQIFTGELVSEELDGITRDSHGVVRPKHRRRFPQGLWQMILENAYSRVYLGVHWHFDAFALNSAGAPDLSQNIGGVRLGLDIAEDIFAAGKGLAPRRAP